LKSAAKGGAMNGSDDGLGAVFKRDQHVPHWCEIALVPRCDLAELLDVGAGNERAAATDQDNRLNRGIYLQGLYCSRDPFGHTWAEGVDRRVVDRDDADAIALRHGYELIVGFHGRNSPELGR